MAQFTAIFKVIPPVQNCEYVTKSYASYELNTLTEATEFDKNNTIGRFTIFDFKYDFKLSISEEDFKKLKFEHIKTVTSYNYIKFFKNLLKTNPKITKIGGVSLDYLA